MKKIAEVSDLNMLFPEVRVVMSAFDKVVLGLPAVAGGIPIILNLLPTMTVLFLVVGFYLGLTGEVEHDQDRHGKSPWLTYW